MSEPEGEDVAPKHRKRRARWFRRAPINLGELAVETIAVVFGILLALGIDDWHQSLQNRALADEAMRSMRVELDGNYRHIEAHVRRMEAMAGRMAGAPDNRGKSPRPCYAWDEWNGLDLQTYIDAAYQTAIATRALIYMPFERARKVSSLYAAQQHLDRVQNVESRFVLSDTPRTLAACSDVVMEIAGADRRWLQDYAGVTDELGLPRHARLAPPIKPVPARGTSTAPAPARHK